MMDTDRASAQDIASAAAMATAPRPLRRRLRRVGMVGSVVLVVLLGVGYLLPIWASTDQGRAYVLERMNRKLNGSLQVRHWELRWFGGTEMDGVTLTGRDGRTVFACEKIKTDLTLWGWLWGNYDVGNTTITSPRVVATHYPDGSNDIAQILADPRPGHTHPSQLRRVLGSLRGAIKVTHGEVILRTTTSMREVHLTDVDAVAPIASSDTLIHVTMQGNSTDGLSSRPVVFEGTLPPVEAWGRDKVGMLRDLELEAGLVPVAPLAEWLGLSGEWEKAFGPVLERVRLVNRPAIGGGPSEPVIELRGASGNVAARVQMVERNGTTSVTVPARGNYYARANLTMAEPLAAWLAYVNPVLGYGVPGKGTVQVDVTDATVPLEQIRAAKGTALVSLTNVELYEKGLLEDVSMLSRSAVPSPPPPGSGPAVATLRATIDSPTRVQIGDGVIACDRLVISLPARPRMTFTGSTTTDGKAQLLLTLPVRQLGIPDVLGSSTVDLSITGTVDKPVLDRRPLLETPR